jgi:hypothetical protein
MGEKITPATPVIVNRGMKATAMINVEKNIGVATSPAALMIR